MSTANTARAVAFQMDAMVAAPRRSVDTGEVSTEINLDNTNSFYYHDVTQQKQARRFGLSRPRVSRPLKRARKDGGVEIRVHQRLDLCAGLEREFDGRFWIDRLLVSTDQRDPQPQRGAMVCLVVSHSVKTLAGIGDLSEDGNMASISWFTAQEVAEAGLAGIADDIMDYDFIDILGQPSAAGMQGRAIGLTTLDLLRIPDVIAIATENAKAAAILVAFRTGAINTVPTSPSTRATSCA